MRRNDTKRRREAGEGAVDCGAARWLAGALVLGVVLGAAALPAPAQVTFEPRVRIAWDRLYDYPDIVAHLQRLHQAWPGVTRLEILGKSVQGRDLPLLVIQDPATGPEDAKAAMWIDGNVHGNEVQGGEAALYTAWLLLERRDLAPIRKLVAERVFYIYPMVNPDGRAFWFEEPNTMHSSRSGLRPTDNDHDGLFDEDGPDDLDGDGEILMMRKRVPMGTGRHRLDPNDPRVLVPADPEKGNGDWEILGLEGIDNDGDGRINEDGPGGYDMNRNWPSGWRPDFIQYGAGDYPFSLPETRAVGTFLLAHPNVAAVQSFHNAGGMILRGPGYEGFGAYPREDQRVYDRIGREGEAMLPFYRYMTIWKDLYSVYGGFVNWTYEGIGIFSFTNELWSSSQLAGTPRGEGEGGAGGGGGRGGDRPERYRLDDRLLFGESLADWKPFHHPLYGDIELGGRVKETGRVPPPFLIEEMLHRNAAFCLYHAERMPEVSIRSLEVTPLGDGTYAVAAAIENDHLIPTRAAIAAKDHMGRPDLLAIDGEGVEVIAGGLQPERFRPESFRPVEHEPARLVLNEGIGSHEIVRARWIVRGEGGVRVTIDTEKGGRASREAVLE